VIQKSDEREGAERSDSNEVLVRAETLRSTSQPKSGPKKEDSEEKGEHISLFWRVFGGTIISISSLIVITLYNNLSTGISDIRTDLNKERTAREELVKKEDFNKSSTNIYERIRTLDALKVELEGLREKVTADGAAVEGVKKDTGVAVEGLKKEVATAMDGLKKEVAATTDLVKKDEALMEIQKERLTAVESLKKDVAGIEVLKDKLASTMADVKAMRDDVGKLQSQGERNRSGELERKASQDVQYKQIEDTLKEMQKGLQDCREKLARLEGAQPGTTPRATTIPSIKP
jgi:chromosome segregation ATPase